MSDTPDASDARNSSATTAIPFATSVDSCGPSSGVLFGMSPPTGLDHTFYFPDAAHSVRLPLALVNHPDEVSANTTDTEAPPQHRRSSTSPNVCVPSSVGERLVVGVPPAAQRVAVTSSPGEVSQRSEEVLAAAMRSLVLHADEGGPTSTVGEAQPAPMQSHVTIHDLPPTHQPTRNAAATTALREQNGSLEAQSAPPPATNLVPPLPGSAAPPARDGALLAKRSSETSSFTRVTGPPPAPPPPPTVTTEFHPAAQSQYEAASQPSASSMPLAMHGRSSSGGDVRGPRESQSRSPLTRPVSAVSTNRPATSASGQYHAASGTSVRRSSRDEVPPERMRSSTSMSAGFGPTSAGAISAFHGYLNRNPNGHQSAGQPSHHDSGGGSAFFDPYLGARRGSIPVTAAGATYTPEVVHPHSVGFAPHGTVSAGVEAQPARQGWRYDHGSYATRPPVQSASTFVQDAASPPSFGVGPMSFAARAGLYASEGAGVSFDGRPPLHEPQGAVDRLEDSSAFGRPASPRAGTEHRHRHVRATGASSSARLTSENVSPQTSEHGSEGGGAIGTPGGGLVNLSSFGGAAAATAVSGSASPTLGGGGGAWRLDTEKKPDIASPGTNSGSVAAPVLHRSAAETVQRKKEEKAEMVNVDEDEFLEKQRRNAAVSSAMHSIPWLQRKVEPNVAFGNDKCGMCVAPRFWERIDWTLRATFLAVLPATILSLDPATTGYFVLPSTVASFAYWISAPTLGAGLREFFVVLKGSIIALAMLSVVLAVQPTSQGVFVLLYFLQILIVAFVAESVKKTSAWCVSVFMLQLYSAPDETNYAFVRDFFVAVLIGCAFGLVAFLIPRINWAHTLAQGCCTTYGSSLSIAIQGAVHSFWCRSEMEREYQLIRIKQLLQVCNQCQETFETRFGEAEFEPHTGLVLANLKYRASMLDDICRVVQCLLQLVENVDVKPDILDSPLLKPFGERLEPALNVLASAIDSTLLKICDFKHPIYFADLQLFLRVRLDFQEQLSQIRQELILSNDDYRTDESDVFLGAYLFCVDELAERIGNFSEPTSAPSRIAQAVRAPVDDLFSAVDTIRYFLKVLLTQGALIRRAKEAIKLAFSMTLPLLIQVFLLNPQDATPVAGPSIIAWVYQRTGAESFSYASNRVLGTVIGSLTALIAVQLAAGRLWLMYLFLGFLALCGNFVQTSKNYQQAGNALVFSVISVVSQYQDQSAAINRIQQNVFAILIYFAIAYIAWPVRAIEKLSLEFDTAVRSYREAMFKLLGSMDSSVGAIQETCNDVDEHWRDSAKHISRQASLIPAAVKEPTMIGAAFPEQPWLKLVQSQKNLSYLSWMMQFAFRTFERSNSMSCGGGDPSHSMNDGHEENSLHWIVVRRLAPQARLVAELIYAACDLYLLSMSHAEMVPVQHLVRLRVAMVEEYRRIVDTYCNTLILRLHQSDENEDTFVKTLRRPVERGGGASLLSTNKLPSPILRQPGGTATTGQRQPSSCSTAKNPQQDSFVTPIKRVAAAEKNQRHVGDDIAMDGPVRSPPLLSRGAAEASSGREKALDATDTELLEIQPQLRSVSDRDILGKPSPSAAAGSARKHAPLGEKLLLRPEPVSALPASPTVAGATSSSTISASKPSAQPLQEKSTADSAARGAFAAGESAEQPPSPIVDVALHDELDEGMDDPQGNSVASASFVLRNRDIHSLEAFLFGMRASVVEVGEFQKAMLEVQNAIDIMHRL